MARIWVMEALVRLCDVPRWEIFRVVVFQWLNVSILTTCLHFAPLTRHVPYPSGTQGAPRKGQGKGAAPIGCRPHCCLVLPGLDQLVIGNRFAHVLFVFH